MGSASDEDCLAGLSGLVVIGGMDADAQGRNVSAFVAGANGNAAVREW